MLRCPIRGIMKFSNSDQHHDIGPAVSWSFGDFLISMYIKWQKLWFQREYLGETSDHKKIVTGMWDVGKDPRCADHSYVDEKMRL